MPLFRLLLLQACFVSLLAAQNQIPKLSLSKDKPFKLRTFMSHVLDGKPNRYRYQFDESYSSEQRRSVIKYNTLGQGRQEFDSWFKTASVPFAGTLYIDGPTRLPLVVYNTFNNILRCKELDWSKVEELFQIDVIKSLSNNEQILDADQARIHGPSNLLFWLESIRNDMTQVKTGLNVEVRGIPSLMFKHPFTGSVSAQTYSYYAKSQIGQGGEGIPMRVTIDYDHGKFVQYDFHMGSEIGVEQKETQVGETNYSAEDLLFDEFTVPRAAGCSAAGNHSDIASLMRLTLPQDSFAFTVQLPKSIDGRDIVQRVAYNRRLNLMRIDQDIGVNKYNSLIDFKHGRMQLVIANEAAKNDVASKLITTIAMMQETNKEKCVAIESPKMDANVNLMLFGSLGGNWRYLGLARLRGMRARVFELHDSEWPFWLRQSVSYSKNWNSDDKDSTDIHKAAVGPNLRLNTVIYIQDSGDTMETHIEGSGHLIGMEIFVIYADTDKILRNVPVSISNFAWRVIQLEGWPRMSDVFSLADQCAASGGTNQHIHVDISLDSDSLLIIDGAKRDLSVGHTRDLALIESLQSDLGIPAPMIYDMRSSIEFEGNKTRVSVSFSMAKSKQPLVRLRFYGKGTVKLDSMTKVTTMSATFADCYKITAQKKVNTFFGYGYSSPQFGLCYVESVSDISVLVRPNEKLKPRLFELDESGPLDLYLVHHDFDAAESSLVADLRNVARRTRAGEEQQMKRLLVPILSQKVIKVSFIVRKFQISDIYDRQDEQLPQINSKDAKKLRNFGLVPDSNLVKLHKLKANDMNPMKPILDFAACRMACLLDDKCETFSYCLRGSQIECALTSVDFGQANLIFQLIDNVQNQTKNSVNGKMITLSVGNDQNIMVKRQASCELRQKSHLDLFSRSQRQLKASKMDDLVIQTASAGREGCARQCFDQTEAVLPKLAALPDQINSNIGEMLANQGQETVNTDSVFEHQKDTGRGLCLGFFYLDALNMNSLPKSVAERFQAPPINQTQEASSGFCVFKKTGKPVQSSGKSESDAEEQLVALEEFMFEFETTYERQPGLKLIEGKKTSLELEALRKFSNSEGSSSSPDELEILKGLIDKRENTQSVLMTGAIDLAICARACTLQLVGPWPACRSFDMVIHPSGINSTNTLCYLNSISYADALEAGREDLISIDKTHLITQVHYEPIFNTDGLARWRPSSTNQSAQQKSSNSLVMLFISTIGLIIGLSLGVAIGKRVSGDIIREASLLDEHQPQIQIGPDDSLNLGSIAVQ